MTAELQRLLNDWQRDFPLDHDPFGVVGTALGWSRERVLEALAHAHAQGVVSRIGGVFAPGCGGDAMLAAMAVPLARIETVAARVSAHPGVNHNYLREHPINLWFVITGADQAQVEQGVCDLEADTGLPILRLRMVRPYRIDLGFDLGGCTATHAMRAPREGCVAVPSIPAALRPLAALVEEGLALEPFPYARWAALLGWCEEAVFAQLRQWLDEGVLKRFGIVVRHHELGYVANAMAVWDVPDAAVDAVGEALAHQPGVTLVYQRQRAATWPYNLYAMVHGRDREAVRRVLEAAACASGAMRYRGEVLFSVRRFKQTGGRRFRGWTTPVVATEETTACI